MSDSGRKSIVEHALEFANRGSTLARKRLPWIRHLIPRRLVVWLLGAQSRATEFRRYTTRVRHRSRLVNIFHCCVHKSGSQWIKSVLTDHATFRYSGLTHYHYQSRELGGADERSPIAKSFGRPFPPRAIVSPLYVSYDVYRSIPKNDGPYRAIFVLRDPRDLLVSWIPSTRKNHVRMSGDLDSPWLKARAALRNARDFSEEMDIAIEYWLQDGRFDQIRSWVRPEVSEDESVKVFRYEDLVGPDGRATFEQVFEFLEIPIPPTELDELLAAYDFRRLSGREPGQVSSRSHLRSGTGGSWRKQFTSVSEIAARFKRAAGPLVEEAGYQW